MRRPALVEARAGLAGAFARRRAWLVAGVTALLYALAYLLLARALIIAVGAGFSRLGPVPRLDLAPGLSPRFLIDPFNPPAILYLADAVALAPPAPILFAALLVGALVGANVALAVETLACARSCGRSSAVGVLGALPSFLASFACCAPTVLFVLGGNAAVAVVALIPYAVPLALALLVVSLAWSAARFARVSADPDAIRGVARHRHGVT